MAFQEAGWDLAVLVERQFAALHPNWLSPRRVRAVVSRSNPWFDRQTDRQTDELLLQLARGFPVFTNPNHVPNSKLQWPVRGRMMAIAAAAPMEMMFFDGMVAKGLLAIVLRSPTVRARLHNNQCGVVGCEP